ncbi:bifunctional diguanylate cyclase/phosphodiesterase [Hydrogenimonas sp.]
MSIYNERSLPKGSTLSLKKLMSLVISLLLLFLLGSVLAVYFAQSKNYFEKQLITDSQKTAHMLALSLKPVLGDREKIVKLVDLVFENGNYSYIELKDMKKKSLYRRVRKESSSVPKWFEKMIEIDVPLINELILSDDEFVTLYLQADRSAAYTQLYQLFLYTIFLFVLFGFIGLSLLNVILRIVLRSLESIKNQAEGIIHNRFIVQKEIPETEELRNVAIAMNSMVKRVKELYQRSSEVMKETQEMLYRDSETGLFNRRYFMIKLPEYLMANDTRSRGSLVVIKIHGIPEGNKKIGHKKMDEFLLNFAKTLKYECKKIHEPLVCRLNGTEFALVLPVYNAETAKEFAGEIMGKSLYLSEKYDLRTVIKLSIGICEYEQRVQVGKLLSCVDSALTEASVCKEDHIEAYGKEDTKRYALGKTEWREIILKAIDTGHLMPVFTPVHDLKLQRDVLHTLSFDIVYDGKTIKYGEFLPAVIELGLEETLMDFEFDYMRTHRFSHEVISFEMIADMLEESDKMFVFEDRIKEITENLRGPLFIEISEYDILSLEPIVVERVAIELKKHGVRFAINRFGGERGEYSYLKYSAPAYVKMGEKNYMDLDAASRHALLTLLGSLGIKLIVTGVEVERVPKLRASGIRYIMYS